MARDEAREGYAFIADLYDQVGPYRDRPDVAYYVAAAKTAGGPVLELGCGTGRVLIPTARAGVEIVGLDASTAMLSECRAKLDQEPAGVQSIVELVEGDMRGFDLRRQFALATFPFRPFQHLITVEDQLSCLRTVHAHLAGNGRILLDVFNPSLEALANRTIGEEFGDEPEFVMADGRRVIRTHKVAARDRIQQVNHVELVYYITYPDGREERLVDAFTMRYFFRYEMEHLLARTGFEVETVHSGFDGSPYGSQYPGELIFTARKVS